MTLRLALATAGLVAIAAIVVLMVRASQRAVDRELAIEVVAPRPDGWAAAERVVFVWRPVAPAALYRLRVTDETGDVVRVQSTADTLVIMRSDVGLASGTTYLWQVDALLADDRAATTGIQRFTTR
jgi:hypothetical protein